MGRIYRVLVASCDPGDDGCDRGVTTVAFFAGGNVSPGVKEDRGNRWVLKAFSGIAILLAYLSAYTDRIDFWTIDGDRTRWVGLAAFVAGSILRLLPVFMLKDRFSGLVAIQRGISSRRAACTA